MMGRVKMGILIAICYILLTWVVFATANQSGGREGVESRQGTLLAHLTSPMPCISVPHLTPLHGKANTPLPTTCPSHPFQAQCPPHSVAHRTSTTAQCKTLEIATMRPKTTPHVPSTSSATVAYQYPNLLHPIHTLNMRSDIRTITTTCLTTKMRLFSMIIL